MISKRSISARSNGRYIRRYEGSLCPRCLKNQIDEEYFKYVRRGVIGD